MSEIQNAIEVKNLKKGFGGRVLFENFSLNVKANTIHAIIGPNGSGKTTLLRLITGVYQPNAGTINIAGKYAMELENDYLYEEQTGLENLRIFGKYFGFEINDRSDSYCSRYQHTAFQNKFVTIFRKGDTLQKTLHHVVPHQELGVRRFFSGKIADQILQLPCCFYHKSTSKYCRRIFSTRNIPAYRINVRRSLSFLLAYIFNAP